MKWYSDTTQIAWACEKLSQGEEISHACEYEAVRGWRLSQIISNLRKIYGWPIDTHYRGKNRIGFYKIRAGTDVTKLRKPKSYNDYLEKKEALKKKGAATPSSRSDSNNPTSENTGKK